MNFFKEFSISTVSTFGITIFSFINNIIVTRQIGPEGRGKYAIISNLILLLALLVGEGLRKSNTIVIAKSRKMLSGLLFRGFIYLLFSTLLFLLIYLVKENWISLIPNMSDELLMLGLLITLLTISLQSFQSLFIGLRKIYEYNILQIIPVSITLILNVIGIFLFEFGLIAIIINLLIGITLSALLGFFWIKREIKPDNSTEIISENPEIKKQFSPLFLKSTISAILLFLIFRGDIFLVNFFLDPVSVGIFSIAVLFSEIFQKIPNIVGPLLVSRTASQDSMNSISQTVRLVRFLFLFNLVFVVLLSLLGKQLITTLFGLEFLPSYIPLMYLLPALLFFGPGTIFYSYFIGKSYPLAILIINTIISIMNIILNVIFIPLYGINAAAMISSGTYFLWTLMYLIYFHSITGMSFYELSIIKKNDIKYIINSFRN